MGQAAGSAAYLALKSSTIPRNIEVQALQERLERDGVYLGRQNERLAAVAGSSHHDRN
jgi:hypothetical protein